MPGSECLKPLFADMGHFLAVHHCWLMKPESSEKWRYLYLVMLLAAVAQLQVGSLHGVMPARAELPLGDDDDAPPPARSRGGRRP